MAIVAAPLRTEPPRQATPPLIAPVHNAGRSSAVVALSFLVGTALSGLLGLLIGVVLGQGPDTDAFLAAYSVYLVFLLFGANLRVALLPLVGSGADEMRLRRRGEDALARITSTGLGLAVFLLCGAPLAGWLLTAGAQGGGFEVAAGTLAILAPAAFCQLLGAAQSATLAAGQRFTVSAALYVASSATTVALATILMLVLGALGAAIGVLGGALVLAFGHVFYLGRFGLAARPRLRLLRERASYRLAASALGGAALPLAFQVNLSIALAVVTGAVGVVTAYTYGYFLPVLLTSLTGASIGFVSMPRLVADLERRGKAAAEDYVRVLSPLGAFLYLPLAAACAALGRPVLDAVLEGPLAPATIDLLWDILRIFLVMGVAWVLATPASTAALSMRRYRSLALIALCALPTQLVAVSIAASQGPRAAATAHAVIGVLMVIAVFVDVFGRDAARLGATVIARSSPAAMLALVFPALAAVTPDGWMAHLAAAIVGLAAYLGLAFVLWSDVRHRLLALVGVRA